MSERRLKYPKEFSPAACNAVETEALKADRDLRFYRSRPEARPDRPHTAMPSGVRRWTDDEEDIIEYILRVGVAFGLQACGLGSLGWSPERIREETNEFFGRLTFDAYHTYIADLRSLAQMRFVSTAGNIQPELDEEFKKSAEWRRFEEALLAVAEQPAAQHSQSSDRHPSASGTPQSADLEPGEKNPPVAEGAMGDFLAELFDQFDQEEQSKTRAAEESTKEILARGDAAASDRQRAAGSYTDPVDPDWVQSLVSG